MGDTIGDNMDIQIEAILQGGQFKRLLEARTLEVRNKYDLKKAEMEILYFLSQCGDHNTSSDIYHQLRMNKGHISQAVDSLCRRKYIIAIPDKNDRRYVHYEILDSAHDILKEVIKRREEMNRQIVDGISEEELRAFRKVAFKIRTNIEKMI